jgi:hypothetical protein
MREYRKPQEVVGETVREKPTDLLTAFQLWGKDFPGVLVTKTLPRHPKEPMWVRAETWKHAWGDRWDSPNHAVLGMRKQGYGAQA